MKLDYKNQLDETFHQDSRVWVYQSSRIFTLAEALEIEDLLEEFVDQWQSHGVPVKGDAYLFFGQFVIFVADETATGVSGCSTDSSVRLVRDMGHRFDVNMFDRTTLAFFVNGKIELLPLAQLHYAISNGFINGDTFYFNNLVQTKAELENQWIIPVKESWLAERISHPSSVS